MIPREPGINLRASLREALARRADQDAGHLQSRIDHIAGRQERTVDALLERLFHNDPDQRREAVVLADEVGLGKTFVALCVAWSVWRRRRADPKLSRGPVLVVTPTSRALYNKWHDEACKFRDLVLPEADRGAFVIERAERLETLLTAMRKKKTALVIARASALGGRIGDQVTDHGRLVLLHQLAKQHGLSVAARARLAPYDSRVNLQFHQTTTLLRQLNALLHERWTHFGATAPTLSLDHVAKGLRRLGRVEDLRTKGHNLRLIEGYIQSLSSNSRAYVPGPGTVHGHFSRMLRCVLAEAAGVRAPLVIVDEIHNWKNHPTSYAHFRLLFGRRFDRLLGLSATPFQLHTGELVQVLATAECLRLPRPRLDRLAAQRQALREELHAAEGAGLTLRSAWAAVEHADLPEVERAWTAGEDQAVRPRVQRALAAARAVRQAHTSLRAHLHPVVVRHRRETDHRRWLVGKHATAAGAVGTRSLTWQPGLDVTGDAELVHYLAMRAEHERKGHKGTPGLGAELGGSFAHFRGSPLRRMERDADQGEAAAYLGFVRKVVGSDEHPQDGLQHPKIEVTSQRALDHWRRGEKTLVFCFNTATAKAVHIAVQRAIEDWRDAELAKRLGVSRQRLPARLRNLQAQLRDRRKRLHLLFQLYPLALAPGVPLGTGTPRVDLRRELAAVLAQHGPPHRRRGSLQPDLRRVIAAAETVLARRLAESWRPHLGHDAEGLAWLERMVDNAWVIERGAAVEGIRRTGTHPADLDEDQPDTSIDTSFDASADDPTAAWRSALANPLVTDALAPYLGGGESPSLLLEHHLDALTALPAAAQRLAAQMFRRLLISPEFLARYVLPHIDPDDESTDRWVPLIQEAYVSPLPGGEALRERFAAYLETLASAAKVGGGLERLQDALTIRNAVQRVFGGVSGHDRTRYFTGFNTPAFPEVLVVTSVGQEGIDLHRECRHVIHHDLPWNPAILEQRTGRVDRIGSKTERVRASVDPTATLDVVVPYLRGTYDQRVFEVVHGRAHLFEVTMGGDYRLDGRQQEEWGDEDETVDDVAGEAGERGAVPLPECIAGELRLRLEAE
jgi:hypothetical protein